MLQRSRQALAQLVGARCQDVVPLVNATAAINIVLANTRLQPGDLVMTTSIQYNAVHPPL